MPHLRLDGNRMSIKPSAFAVIVAGCVTVTVPMACFATGDEREARQILFVDDHHVLYRAGTESVGSEPS